MVETWKIVESVRKKTCCLHSSVVLNSAVHGVLMTGVCRRVPGSGLGVAEAAILRLLIRNSYLVFVPFQAQTSLCLKPWEPLTNPRHFPSDRSNEDVLTFMANPFQPHLSSGWELVARKPTRVIIGWELSIPPLTRREGRGTGGLMGRQWPTI